MPLRLVRGALVLALWGGLAAVTYARTAVWASDQTLWADAARRAPMKPRPQINLGRQLDLAGDLGAAERYYRAALTASFDPRYPAGKQRETRAAAETNLAHLLMKRGDLASAMRLIDSILEEWPAYPYAHFNRAIILRHIGACELAQHEFAVALLVDPTLKVPTPLCARSS